MVLFHSQTRRHMINTILALTQEDLLWGLRTTKAQTSLRIRAVWSVALLFAY